MTQTIEEMRSLIKKMGHLPRGKGLELIDQLEDARRQVALAISALADILCSTCDSHITDQASAALDKLGVPK